MSKTPSAAPAVFKCAASSTQNWLMNGYPTQTELLSCLTNIANVAGDTSNIPFRVDVIPLHGKPPMYSVMIKSPAKDLLRRQIGQILSRPFALGATSFMLTGSEAVSLVGHAQPK